jgi:hypothetical protein
MYTACDHFLSPTTGKVLGIPTFLSVHPRLFNAFKLVLYALLTLNMGLFLRHGTLNEALDSLGWVLLLVVFDWVDFANVTLWLLVG